ncbi:MAG TPA: FxLYD domain-containing protein [Dehalococcoidia bacterium]|nr:FxLYD domain-containing protein [Dehalococcoidia bacterium]
MKRILAVSLISLAALAGMAQTCVVTHESLTTIGDNDTFAGELQNDSGVDILQHKFRIAFLNSNGAVIESRTVDGCLRSLQAGESDFFAVSSNQPHQSTTIGLARLANLAEDPNFKVGRVEEGDIDVHESTASREATTLTVEGKITNHDSDTLEDPNVCVVVWDDDDRVITTAKQTNIDDLDEDETFDFSIEIDVPDDTEKVDHVDVWADGLEDDDPVSPGSQKDVDVTEIATATPTTTSTATATPTATPEAP